MTRLTLVKTRILIPAMGALALVASMTACNDDDTKDTWEQYAEWREENNKFFEEQQYLIVDGRNFYSTLSPQWDRG